MIQELWHCQNARSDLDGETRITRKISKIENFSKSMIFDNFLNEKAPGVGTPTRLFKGAGPHWGLLYKSIIQARSLYLGKISISKTLLFFSKKV